MTKYDLVYIIDDDPVFAEVLKFFLLDQGFTNVKTFGTGKEYINNLYKLPKLVLVDYTMTDSDGKELLQETLSFDSDIIVVVISSQKSVEAAVETMRIGAFDYLVKDGDLKNRLNQLFDVIYKLSIRVEKMQKRQRKKIIAVCLAIVIIGVVIFLNKYLLH